ncbi:MAG: tetratricopeptide repeat protein [Polyangiaceae bacterium]
MRLAAFLSCAMLLVGCVKSPGAQLQERLAAVNDARNPQLLLSRAHAFASIADYTRAEQYLRLALEAGAAAAEVTPLLIEVCVRDQRYLDAVQHAEAYLRRHPDDARLRFVLASLEAAVGNSQRARTEYERVLAHDADNADVHYALAVVLRDNFENLAQADRHFREYLRLRPSGSHAEEARAALLEVLP